MYTTYTRRLRHSGEQQATKGDRHGNTKLSKPSNEFPPGEQTKPPNQRRGFDKMDRPTITPTKIKHNADAPGSSLVSVRCPHCKETHSHGWPAGGDIGDRVPHCSDKALKKQEVSRAETSTGYYIEMPEEEPEHRRNPPEPLHEARMRRARERAEQASTADA
jgi:hypothetical protein